VLEVRNLSKRFDMTQALDDVSLRLHAGEIHALVGENGAGKSTLIKILTGVVQSDAGEVFVEGKAVHLANAQEAQAAGLAAVYQEPLLFPDLDVAENIFITHRDQDLLVNWPRMYAEAQVLDRQLTPDEALDRLCRIPLVFQPGSQWRYSIATDVLGEVVAAVTGKTLGESLNEMIFEPLGMKDTRFQVPEEDLERLSVNYQANHYGRLEPMPRPDRDPVVIGVKTESGGGGLVGTTADYFRFAQMLLNEGTLDGVRLLGPRTVRYMATDHLKKGMEVFGNVDGGYGAYGFGLGFRVLKTPGRHRHLSGVGEYGWAGAANTYFWIDPNADLLGIFMSQLMPSGLHDVARMFQSQAYSALND